jgi:hypothetical protein
MFILHSKPLPYQNDYTTRYAIQFPNGNTEIEQVLPWMTEIGFERDETLVSLKSRLEHLLGEEVTLKLDEELQGRMIKAVQEYWRKHVR